MHDIFPDKPTSILGFYQIFLGGVSARNEGSQLSALHDARLNSSEPKVQTYIWANLSATFDIFRIEPKSFYESQREDNIIGWVNERAPVILDTYWMKETTVDA